MWVQRGFASLLASWSLWSSVVRQVDVHRESIGCLTMQTSGHGYRKNRKVAMKAESEYSRAVW